MKCRLFALLYLITLIALSLSQASAEHPLVLVSIEPQRFIVDRIAGDLVSCQTLIPPGGNHETFEPGMKQLALASKAQVYFSLGHPHLGFEAAWMQQLKSESSNLKIINSSAGFSALADDPHIWNAPEAMMHMAIRISNGLVTIMPEHTQQLLAGLKVLLNEIDKTSVQVKSILGELPEKKRSFLVFHPAWHYFAKSYGLTELAIEEHGKEPGAARIASVIAQAKEAGIHVIFVQPQFSKSVAELIASELNGRIVELDPVAYNWTQSQITTAQAIRDSYK